MIGLEVFDRREAFDPRVDSIVRVEARRLRYKLEEYYRTEGREDVIRIVLRKGSYVPIFEYRSRQLPASGISSTQRRAIALVRSDQCNPAPDAEQVGRRDSPPPGARADSRKAASRWSRNLLNPGRPKPSSPNLAAPTGSRMAFPTAIPTAIRSPLARIYVVEGSIEFQPDDFHLILQLQHGADGSYIWSERAGRPARRISARIDHLAQHLWCATW